MTVKRSENLAILFISIFIWSCSSATSLPSMKPYTDGGTTSANLLPTPDKSPSPQPNAQDIAILKNFAEKYEPRSTQASVIPSPPLLNQITAQAVTNLAATGSREYEKYIVLIFLRISWFQIEHFKQRYELGRTNPLTQEFYRLVGENDYIHKEMMLPYLADDYVQKHPELLEYKLIKREMERIAKAGEKIKKELDETMTKQDKIKSNK